MQSATRCADACSPRSRKNRRGDLVGLAKVERAAQAILRRTEHQRVRAELRAKVDHSPKIVG